MDAFEFERLYPRATWYNGTYSIVNFPDLTAIQDEYTNYEGTLVPASEGGCDDSMLNLISGGYSDACYDTGTCTMYLFHHSQG